jgi:hypothetical protein
MLGIYLLCYQVDGTRHQLFPGDNQYERYRALFQRLLNFPHVVQELERRGCTPDQFGTHSSRKGPATFASSGSTACPPQAAICIRAGSDF